MRVFVLPWTMNIHPLFSAIDNAAMIAWASMHRFLAQDHDDIDIDIMPKWNIEDVNVRRPRDISL
jgi:tRNA A37 threonylcarbamoyltransferase TsaD